MHHEHMKHRCPGTSFLGPARLDGYRLAFRYPSTSFPGGGAADIVKEEGALVFGALYRSNREDMAALDLYEDVELGGYRRLSVRVIYDEEEFGAITYEVVNKLAEDMPPVPAYRDLLLQGARMSALPGYYQDDLAKTLESS